MAEPTALRQDMTDEQFRRQEAKRQALRVASNLRNLADRISLVSRQFDRDDRPAASIVADIASDYMQQSGSAGAVFWGLIHELGSMDRAEPPA